MIANVCKILGIILLLVATCGFSSCRKDAAVEGVASQWCKTVRGSQAICAYPLSQDMEPGDFFLVQTPIQKQQEEYVEGGYLPLDIYLGRLNATEQEYADHYNAAYLEAPFSGTPLSQCEDNATLNVSFPSFTVKVNSDTGISAGFPVYSIPIALQLVNSDNAVARFTVSNATTYGLPLFSWYGKLKQWAAEPINRTMLAEISESFPEKSKSDGLSRPYIRVVNRVYRVRAVDINLADGERSGVGVGAGFFPGDAAGGMTALNATVTDYQNKLSVLGKLLNGGAAPGGSAAFTLVSNRTVGIRETFPRPLVLGYLGFDVPILSHGRLGPPVGTIAQVEGGVFEKMPLETELVNLNLYKAAIKALPWPGQKLAAYDFIAEAVRDDDLRKVVVCMQSNPMNSTVGEVRCDLANMFVAGGNSNICIETGSLEDCFWAVGDIKRLSPHVVRLGAYQGYDDGGQQR
ncbi:MAG: hypothetical protein ACNI3A_07995 [Desulfovibrio sp.]|uniref:hypothetical protein n=1 Tax=Desulfovibrio sp. 7SRBS1 TaxID=3378064 RepID=UPI003B40532E